MASKFLKIKCKKCKNEQIIFEKPASEIRCLECGELLVSPRGGKADIKTKIISVLKTSKETVEPEKPKANEQEEEIKQE
jgi:small subunit ribosomal protein S27e